jgi:hypothetical protein
MPIPSLFSLCITSVATVVHNNEAERPVIQTLPDVIADVINEKVKDLHLQACIPVWRAEHAARAQPLLMELLEKTEKMNSALAGDDFKWVDGFVIMCLSCKCRVRGKVFDMQFDYRNRGGETVKYAHNRATGEWFFRCLGSRDTAFFETKVSQKYLYCSGEWFSGFCPFPQCNKL